MKNFKRITTKTGQIRYYVNGKQITSKKGASEYVKKNFSRIDPKELSKQERLSYFNKQRAIKLAPKFRELAKNRFTFKGRFVDKGLQTFLELIKFLPPGERNLSRELPDIRTYGDLLKEIQTMFSKTLNKVMLDDTEWTTPNETRKRTTFENITEIAEALQNDFPNFNLIVKDLDEKTITNKVKALEAIREYETNKIDQFMEDIANVAFVKFQHFASIDFTTKTITINLADSTAEAMQS